ncbi:MAG: hypothetical protein ACI4PF_05545 [Christensenellales bacterium]
MRVITNTSRVVDNSVEPPIITTSNEVRTIIRDIDPPIIREVNHIRFTPCNCCNNCCDNFFDNSNNCCRGFGSHNKHFERPQQGFCICNIFRNFGCW